MATERAILADAFPTNGDQSASRYKFVNLASGKINLNTTLGGSVLGVLEDVPRSGMIGTVNISGFAKVTAGATIAEMADVSSDATGLAKTAATTERILGKAMEAAVAGQVFRILLTPGNAKLT